MLDASTDGEILNHANEKVKRLSGQGLNLSKNDKKIILFSEILKSGSLANAKELKRLEEEFAALPPAEKSEMDKPVIYTVGHSNHPLNYFLSLLREHHVTYIVDVRSVAASSYNPQYNKEPLSNFLKDNGIIFMHLPEKSAQDIVTLICWTRKAKWILQKSESPGILKME